jgi:RNA polymerase sigma factor (sigma-70 family)
MFQSQRQAYFPTSCTRQCSAWKGGQSVSPSETGIAELATKDEEEAWKQIVGRFQPLIDSIARRHRLAPSDAQDVSQYVWMQLLGHVSSLREPRALPGWIATTTRHRCYEILRGHKRLISADPLLMSTTESDGNFAIDDELLRAEQRSVVRQGLAELREDQQELLLLLVADPPVPYCEISRRMQLPIGSIGPTRARLLNKLKNSVAKRLFIEDQPSKASAAA